MDGVHQPAAGHGEAIELPQKRHDFPKRQPELVVEHHHKCDHLCAELRGGGAEGVGGLQRMATLHAPVASVAAADLNVKLPDDHSRDRQFFLIRSGSARRCDRTGTAGLCAGSATSYRSSTRGPPFGLAASDPSSAVSQTAPLVGIPRVGRRPAVV